MELQIRKLNEMKASQENQELKQRIVNNGNNTTLSLGNLKLTDYDMEIVADELKTNMVKEHCSFLPFRLFQRHKSKVFQTTTSMVYQMFFLFLRNQYQKY